MLMLCADNRALTGFMNVVVKTWRINSDSSHGNDYILADTRHSTRDDAAVTESSSISAEI